MISCASGCDLVGRIVRLLVDDRVLSEIRIAAASTEKTCATDLVFHVPMTVGSYDCRLVFPSQASDNIHHSESSSRFVLIVKPHKTSLAVWDVAAPLITNTSSEIKVGVKCSSGCAMTGHEIDIINDAGARVAAAPLGPEPWPGTTGLYWTNVSFIVPGSAGVHAWSVRFHARGPELLHEEASAVLRLTSTDPPEHRVTIAVCSKETKNPLPDVEVRVGSFRGSTNTAGLSTIEVPKGVYELIAWKHEYEYLSQQLEVQNDVEVGLELVPAPEPEDPYWMGGTPTT
jgi:hypothetical protein